MLHIIATNAFTAASSSSSSLVPHLNLHSPPSFSFHLSSFVLTVSQGFRQHHNITRFKSRWSDCRWAATNSAFKKVIEDLILHGMFKQLYVREFGERGIWLENNQMQHSCGCPTDPLKSLWPWPAGTSHRIEKYGPTQEYFETQEAECHLTKPRRTTW